MASKYLAFLDSVATLLTTAFSSAAVPVTVGVKFDMEYDLGTFTGLRLDLYPSVDVIEEEATRREDFYDAEWAMVLTQRYTGASVVPDAWLRERITWAEELIFDVLHPVTRPLILSGAFGEFWGQYVKRTEICDMSMLREHKVFWCELEARFRKLRF